MNSSLPELKQRDGALVNNWYVACLSSGLPAQRPISSTIYDTPLVLFRDALGQPVCLKDRCLHRHALLSEGRVEQGQIVCPYHGWTYDKGGECVHVPSEGRVFCSRQGRKLKKYPAVEQDGCVWVWMGDGAPSTPRPPYRFPHWQEPGWGSYFMVTDFDNEVTQLVENFMDVPHTVFVHSGWFRNQTRMRVPIEVSTANGSVLVTYRQKADEIGFSSLILNPYGRPMTHTDCFIMPNITRVDYLFGDDTGFVISSQCTPVSTLKSRVYTEIAYKLALGQKLLRPFLQFYTRQVIEQDVDIMHNQSRSLRAEFETHYQNTAADLLHERIEALRAEGARQPAKAAALRSEQEAEIWI